MKSVDTLKEMFQKFPGIGPRQSARFVHFLLNQNTIYRKTIARAILDLENEVDRCQECKRFFYKESNKNLCSICASSSRDSEMLMIVLTDTDISQIEKTSSFNGRYYVLGALTPISNTKTKTSVDFLIDFLKSKKSIPKEIICAMPATPDGDNTVITIKQKIKENFPNEKLKISILGRGLSTGSEIEYADPDTLKNALKNRAEF